MASGSSSAGNRPIRPGPYPELTWQGLLVGYLIGALLAMSIGYASLKLGFSIEGSELAAILGFGALRGLMRRRSIVENNINQSLASSVNAASSGMMFSLPALFILGHDFNWQLTVLGCITGGILGIAFIIPLRKQMIDFERLPFPGGIAVATILKSPGAGIRKAWLLLGGAAISAIVQAASLAADYDHVPIFQWLGLPEYLNGIWLLSIMTVGVGYLSGRGGVYFIVGGYICFWMLAPILNFQGLVPSAAEIGSTSYGDVADNLRVTLFRPVGIGMLIGGAIAGVAGALPLVVSAIRSMQQAAKTRSEASKDEMPIRLLYGAVLGAFLMLLVIAELSVPEMSFARGALMAVLGTLWIWMAGVILSECIGRTNWSPLSGMTLIGITILIFAASGMSDRSTVVASVMVGAAMCVAMSQATDLMLDLKSGYLVGAIPRRQQIAQFAGTWLGPILVMGLLFVLHADEPLGGDKYPAPQGVALASVIDGIMGGDAPMEKYAAGAGLGALLSASGIGGLGILVGLGFYLPFSIVLTYSIGTLLRLVSDARFGPRWAEDTGIPIAAGLIVGEALVGVGNAVLRIITASGG